jgi:hypothetical protein
MYWENSTLRNIEKLMLQNNLKKLNKNLRRMKMRPCFLQIISKGSKNNHINSIFTILIHGGQICII